MYRTHLGSRGLPRNDLLCMTHDALSTGTQHLDQPSQGVANTSPIANKDRQGPAPYPTICSGQTELSSIDRLLAPVANSSSLRSTLGLKFGDSGLTRSRRAVKQHNRMLLGADLASVRSSPHPENRTGIQKGPHMASSETQRGRATMGQGRGREQEPLRVRVHDLIYIPMRSRRARGSMQFDSPCVSHSPSSSTSPSESRI